MPSFLQSTALTIADGCPSRTLLVHQGQSGGFVRGCPEVEMVVGETSMVANAALMLKLVSAVQDRRRRGYMS